MTYQLRFTLEAKEDFERLFRFLAEQDIEAAESALDVISRAWALQEEFPFSCRKAETSNPFLRELLIPFGSTGCVALFEIDNPHTVTVLAVRHQREDDYH